MEFDQRPFAEALVDDASQCAADRLAHDIVVVGGCSPEICGLQPEYLCMSDPAGTDHPWLDKRDLAARLVGAGRAVGWKVGPEVLDSLIEARLVPPAEHIDQDGMVPKFGYSETAIRRVLMLVNLRMEGVKDYDQAMIRLFLAGEDFDFEVLKGRIWKETAKAIAKVNAQFVQPLRIMERRWRGGV